jgi:D-cysteine desulfhydrase
VIRARFQDTFLARRFPDFAALPFVGLADVPTPVERATAIAPWAHHDNLWIKRDDLVSPVYGGNKVRRFELLFAEARERGAQTLVTAGGLASTQVMATILHGKKHGFDVAATLFDQPMTEFAERAMKVDRDFGGDIVLGGGWVGSALKGINVYRAAHKPYLILPGASTPTAILGYVDAMLELGEQVDQGLCPRPDIIVTPSGSGGTLAGLAIGAAILGWPTLCVGVRITELFACNRVTIGYLIRSTTRLLERSAKSFRLRTKPNFAIFHKAIGKGYGYPTAESLEAIPQLAHLTGFNGEVTYSAKALVGLKHIAKEHPEKTLLLWQTLSAFPND